MHLDGQTVLVTGASRGLGRAIALAMAEEGANVVLAARDVEALDGVARLIRPLGCTSLVVPCDVRDPASVTSLVAQALARFGQVDTLVNSAGIGLCRPVTEIEPAEWDDVFNTLARGTLLVTQAVLPAMIMRKRGNIINLAPPLERMEVPGFVAYTAAAYALTGLTRTLANEVRRYGINVNGLHPGGLADTKLMRDMLDEAAPLAGAIGLHDPAVITPAAVALARQPGHGLSGDIIDAIAWNTDQGLGAGLG